MARNIGKIAEKLGATQVAELPDTGGGAFGAARMAAVLAGLLGRLEPGQVLPPSQPGEPNWTLHPEVPMTAATHEKLQRLAALVSTPERKVTAMQMAARLLEQVVAACPVESEE